VAETLDLATIGELLDAVGGDHTFVDELVDTFLADAPALLVAIDEALAADDAPSLVGPAHTLKGNSLTLGALELAAVARALEEEGRQGDLSRATDDAERARAELGRVAEALRGARQARWVAPA
jgi:HPt (histidine-containing phosphotransfer) domain-containing protein